MKNNDEFEFIIYNYPSIAHMSCIFVNNPHSLQYFFQDWHYKYFTITRSFLVYDTVTHSLYLQRDYLIHRKLN